MAEEEQLFALMEQNVEFLHSEHDRLRSKYPDQWVAVRGGKVVAAASSAKGIQADLKRKGLDDNRNLVEFIVAEDTRIVAGHFGRR